MSWSKARIKRLRLGMGWSGSELARQLSVDLETVQGWEISEIELDLSPDMITKLERLEIELQSRIDQTRLTPVAEEEMRLRSTTQIEIDELALTLEPEVESKEQQ